MNLQSRFLEKQIGDGKESQLLLFSILEIENTRVRTCGKGFSATEREIHKIIFGSFLFGDGNGFHASFLVHLKTIFLGSLANQINPHHIESFLFGDGK